MGGEGDFPAGGLTGSVGSISRTLFGGTAAFGVRKRVSLKSILLSEGRRRLDISEEAFEGNACSRNGTKNTVKVD
jgi:hypothetical protein